MVSTIQGDQSAVTKTTTVTIGNITQSRFTQNRRCATQQVHLPSLGPPAFTYQLKQISKLSEGKIPWRTRNLKETLATRGVKTDLNQKELLLDLDEPRDRVSTQLRGDEAVLRTQ